MLGKVFTRNRQRGDTIIEVLLAVTIFSLVAVGALSIMNQGSAIAERSLETTLVRDQIDSQVDALRYLHDAYITAYTAGGMSKITGSNAASATAAQRWRYIVDSKTIASPTNLPHNPGNCQFPVGTTTFAINPSTMSILTTSPLQAGTYSKINSSGKAEGLWIEAVGPSAAADGSNTHFVNFYVRACWSSVGVSIPMTIGTVVRLYEPAS